MKNNKAITFASVKKFSLFNEINDHNIKEYSLFKLGDKRIIYRFGRHMASLIRKKVPNLYEDNFAIFATNKYPLNKYCRKNSFLLAEQVAKELKKDLILGEYTYSFNAGSLYDNYSLEKRKREIHIPFIKNKKRLMKKKIKIIMIDDSILSGAALRASLKELKNITRTGTFFSVLDLRESIKPEKYFNDFAFRDGSIGILQRIINRRGYVFTSHMLRTILALDSNKRGNLLNALTKRKKCLFEKAAKIYFN